MTELSEAARERGMRECGEQLIASEISLMAHAFIAVLDETRKTFAGNDRIVFAAGALRNSCMAFDNILATEIAPKSKQGAGNRAGGTSKPHPPGRLA